MPKIGKVNPLEHIEAPSTNLLNNRQIKEELFHLERTISNSERVSSDVAQCLQDLDGSIGTLSDFVEGLTTTMDEVHDTLKKILERLEKDDA